MPVSVPVPVLVVESVHMAESVPDPKEDDKVGGDFWNIVYTLFQKVATILSLLDVACTICADLKVLSGETKSLKKHQRKVINL